MQPNQSGWVFGVHLDLPSDDFGEWAFRRVNAFVYCLVVAWTQRCSSGHFISFFPEHFVYFVRALTVFFKQP